MQVLGTGEVPGMGAIREIRGTRILVVCGAAPAAGALLRMDLAGAVALGEVVDADRSVSPAVCQVELRHLLPQ